MMRMKNNGKHKNEQPETDYSCYSILFGTFVSRKNRPAETERFFSHVRKTLLYSAIASSVVASAGTVSTAAA